MAKLVSTFLLVLVSVLKATIVVDALAPAKAMVFSLQIDIAPGIYLAPYRVNGKRPECLEEVDYFMLSDKSSREAVTYDQEGNALVSGGWLHASGSKNYKFTTAKLIRSDRIIRGERGFFEQLTFATERIDGVSYSFEGQFLSQPEQLDTGYFIDLKGVLTKFKDGQKVTEAKLGFTKLGKE